MKRKRKTVFVGLDGVPFEMIKEFSEAGLMSNVGRVIDRGIFKKMSSSIPEVSSVAWSSIITGKNPGRHGVFGFTDLHPNTYTLRFPNYSDLREPPFWDTKAFRSVIMNVPSTYPARAMNGVHISGFVSVDFGKSVYPPSLVSTLTELDYRVDVDAARAHRSFELFLADLDRTLEARIRTYHYLWETEDWRLFMLVFTGTDRLMHFLWDAHEDVDHRHHGDFEKHFRRIDEIIGEIEGALGDEDLLVIASDHGFEKLEVDVYISYALKEAGFLQFKEHKEAALGNIDSSTKAFTLDPARVYVHLKGKYPYGAVQNNDRSKVLDDLVSFFKSLEIDGKKVIGSMFRKEEIYSGPFMEQAPDLVLSGGSGVNLKANPKAVTLSGRGIFTGKHTADNAFLLAAGAIEAGDIPDKPSIFDVRSIMEKNLRA